MNSLDLSARAQRILAELKDHARPELGLAGLFALDVLKHHSDLAAPIIKNWAELMFALPDLEKPKAVEIVQPSMCVPPAPLDAPLPVQVVQPQQTVAAAHPVKPATIRESHPVHEVSPAPKRPPIARPAANPPRVPVTAIAAANNRLAQSILESWTVNGKRFGDCTVGEVLAACNKRDHTTSLMRAVIKGLPENKAVRYAITPAEAEARRAAASAVLTQQAPTIEATQPEGYRYV